MKKGFTLLEMIFVLTVISIVFLLTIPNIKKVLDIAYTKGCEAQVKIVDAAIIEYRLQEGEDAYSVDELVTSGLLTEAQRTCQNQQEIDIVDGQAYAS